MADDAMIDPNAGGDPSSTPPGAGSGAPAGGAQAGSPVDAEAVRTAAFAEYNDRLKTLAGVDSLEALEEQRKADEAKSLAEQGKFKELADANAAEASSYKERFEQAQIAAAIAGAAAGAVDPATVQALLAGQATVAEDGAVLVGGKPVAEAVTQLLVDKPFLARAAGGSGGGSPGTGGDADAEARAAYQKAKEAGDVAGMLAAKNKIKAGA